MMIASTDPRRVLATSERFKWTDTQAKAISRDYPFSLLKETMEETVTRVYLQFLWLPESIMPLSLLCPCLSRATSYPTDPALLLNLLPRILLAPRAAVNKYRRELAQILISGDGAGEMEDIMMWFAVSHEQGGSAEANEEVWQDEKWRVKYLRRMEQREFKIQIILHLSMISLISPKNRPPAPPVPPSKRRRLDKNENTTNYEERLESFIDTLAMWQLSSNVLNEPSQLAAKEMDERDWVQIFWEKVVEPEFKNKLPELCSELRSKIFPESPFSDDLEALSRSPSPTADPEAVSNRMHSPSMGEYSRERSRSRSLSISLASERSESVGVPPARKKLNREVSMSRVFKGMKRPVDIGNKTLKSAGMLRPEREASRSADQGKTLVAATPTKVRIASISLQNPTSNRGDHSTRSIAASGRIQNGVFTSSGDDIEEIWNLSSSPDVLLLGSGGEHRSGIWNDISDGMECEDGPSCRQHQSRKACVLAVDTPVKGRQKKL